MFRHSSAISNLSEEWSCGQLLCFHYSFWQWHDCLSLGKRKRLRAEIKVWKWDYWNKNCALSGTMLSKVARGVSSEKSGKSKQQLNALGQFLVVSNRRSGKKGVDWGKTRWSNRQAAFERCIDDFCYRWEALSVPSGLFDAVLIVTVVSQSTPATAIARQQSSVFESMSFRFRLNLD